MAATLTLEDFAAGMVIDCGERTITEAGLIGFAQEYDFQPFHLDDAAARKSLLKGLAASGWQTAAVAHRMCCDGLMLRSTCLGSPGVAELRWRKPVRPDQPLRTRIDVTGARPSRSRPEIGFVSMDVTVEQGGETACTYQCTVIFGAKDAGPIEARPVEMTESPWQDVVGIEALATSSVDDIQLGKAIDLGIEELTPERIIGFAQEYDPQPFHLDEAAGKASIFGGLAASGWQLTALWMRRLLTGRKAALDAAGPEKQAAAVGFYGPSPGFFDLEWRRPALAGDALRFFSMPTEIVPLKSRPELAIARSLNGALNQEGALVFQFTGQAMVRL